MCQIYMGNVKFQWLVLTFLLDPCSLGFCKKTTSWFSPASHSFSSPSRDLLTWNIFQKDHLLWEGVQKFKEDRWYVQKSRRK